MSASRDPTTRDPTTRDPAARDRTTRDRTTRDPAARDSTTGAPGAKHRGVRPTTTNEGAGEAPAGSQLSARQQTVLRELMVSYVSSAAPVGSAMISDLLSVPLSSASVRNTLAELSELGLIHKPHASAGRIPTDEGIRLFVDELLHLEDMAAHRRRTLDRSFDEVAFHGAAQLASQVLSHETRQVGFVVSPRLDRLTLRHVSFVRLSSDRILAILVDSSGTTHQRAIDRTQIEGGLEGGWEGNPAQAALDRMSSELTERVSGRTLIEARDLLRREVRSLRSRASQTLERALLLGLQAAEAAIEQPTEADVVIATRLALLEQPEFASPERLRELMRALEQTERLVDLVGELLDGDGVAVALGDELGIAGLAGCALVAAPFGDSNGALGVIGPARMDYQRIIPLVGYCSERVTDKLSS